MMGIRMAGNKLVVLNDHEGNKKLGECSLSADCVEK
jgi:hypothetical protein